MARCIDADKFIAELEQEKTTALEFGDGVAVYEIEHMMNLIGMQPTADVVPKSEVERLKDKYEIIYQPKGMLEANAKADAAREIFEEIEEQIDRGLSVITKILNAKGGRVNGKTVLVSKYDVFIEAKKYIAELKKKYTEVNNEIS